MTMKSWSKGPRRSCNTIVVRRQFGDQATREKPSATPATGTEPGRQSILEACKGEICKAGWQARALQGEGPRVTLLPVVLQGDFPVWSISIAVGAGSFGSEGELVCALFAVDCFLRLQMKRPMNLSWCIVNRGLFPLKEYAKTSGKDRLMVNVNLFRQNTLTQVQRFIQNSNDTDGRDVRLRKNRNDKRSQPLI